MRVLFEGHWPWWLGAIALATVAALMWVIERRLLAVSGSFRRLVTREDVASAEARRQLAVDPRALDAALLAATREAFGDEVDVPQQAASPERAPQPPLTRSVHLVFLLAMAAGGAGAAWATGSWQLRLDLGATYASLIAGGWPMAAVLLLGGMLTGVGTRMAGGCTSGHGLMGCARLQPGSLVATAAFFGTAIGLSLLLLKVAG